MVGRKGRGQRVSEEGEREWKGQAWHHPAFPRCLVAHSDLVASQVLGYTLFQPGLFLDYLAFPYKTAKYVTPLNTMIDFQNRRAIMVDGHDSIMTLTTAQDLAAVVARAVEYEGEWPVIGGICGNKVTVSQILEIGESVRGVPLYTHPTTTTNGSLLT